ncbi:unnamed protein product [Schistosoma spindalis]|nr:unnamed protein product [Schistosoma spindale]
MLAFQQQIFETIIGRLFTQLENKKSIYDADKGAVMASSEACSLKGSNPFIPEAKRNMDKLSGSQQDNILLNAHEIVTIPDGQETGPVDEVQSPELNEALLALANSENKLQLEQNYGSCDINRESCVESYPENSWSNTMNPDVPSDTQNHWETEIYIEPSYPISHENVPGMISHHNAHNFGEIPYNSEKAISAEPKCDRKSNQIVFDVDFPSNLVSTNEIQNEFEGSVAEEPNPNYFESNNPLIISSGFYIQCKKHGLNKVILILSWRYEDLTLFRGGGECWRIQSYTYFFKKSESKFWIFKNKKGEVLYPSED